MFAPPSFPAWLIEHSISDVPLQIGAAQGVSVLPSSGRVSPEPFLPFALKDREKQLRLPVVDFGCFPQSESFGYQRIDAGKQIPSKCVLDGD